MGSGNNCSPPIGCADWRGQRAWKGRWGRGSAPHWEGRDAGTAAVRRSLVPGPWASGDQAEALAVTGPPVAPRGRVFSWAGAALRRQCGQLGSDSASPALRGECARSSCSRDCPGWEPQTAWPGGARGGAVRTGTSGDRASCGQLCSLFRRVPSRQRVRGRAVGQEPGVVIEDLILKYGQTDSRAQPGFCFPSWLVLASVRPAGVFLFGLSPMAPERTPAGDNVSTRVRSKPVIVVRNILLMATGVFLIFS